MNEEPKQRIDNVAAAEMIATAVAFDLAQVASELLTIMGLTLAGGLVGAIACYYVNIDAPKTCSVAGAIVGGAASLTGIGTVISLKVGILLAWLASTLFWLGGYGTILFWFSQKGVSVFSGKSAGEKVTTFFSSMVVGLIPFVNKLPDLTVFTIRTIVLSRREDKEKAQEGYVEYNMDDVVKMAGRPRRRSPVRRFIRRKS